MKSRSAAKAGLFADEHHRKKIDSLGDPLVEIESQIDFVGLEVELGRVVPRPTETMARIPVLKRLCNLSDEQMESPLLDRMSDKRVCGLANVANIPNRTTVWTFESRIGGAGSKARFDSISAQLPEKGVIARGGQILDAPWRSATLEAAGIKAF